MFNRQNKTFVKFLFLLGVAMIFTACDGRPSGVLSQRKMTEVLTEMHKADASMAEKGVLYGKYSQKAPYYRYIFKKYDITQAQFDSSLVWYTKNPQRFENIYDNVLNQLADLQHAVKKGKYHYVDSTQLSIVKLNIWNKRTQYHLTKDSARTRLDFENTSNGFMLGDSYLLRFLQRVAPSDSCIGHQIIFRINYVGGITDSVCQKIHNDSLLRRYTFRFNAKRKLEIKSISGELLGCKAYKGKQNVQIDSISLMRIFDSRKQDSFRMVLNHEKSEYKLKLKYDSLRLIQKVLNRRFLHSKK